MAGVKPRSLARRRGDGFCSLSPRERAGVRGKGVFGPRRGQFIVTIDAVIGTRLAREAGETPALLFPPMLDLSFCRDWNPRMTTEHPRVTRRHFITASTALAAGLLVPGGL